MDSFLPQLLHVLEVALHLVFEMLLGISNIKQVCYLTGDPVDNNWNPANISVVALATPAPAVAVPDFEVQGLDTFIQLR